VHPDSSTSRKGGEKSEGGKQMKKDIILCGVGGQGILSIATVIGEAATEAGINLKQAEVHGMSQRGGDVQSNLRLSTDKIYSDLIPQGGADLIISMEPMESLRYLPYLAKNGTIVTSSKPFINIPNYPDETALQAELDSLPSVVKLDIESVAKDAGNARGANMVLLGMAAPYLEIITVDQLRKAIAAIFARKGEAVVEANLKAFDMGAGR
jgi:indolepyruvate ferredoxin oxidoreductase beta subunit